METLATAAWETAALVLVGIVALAVAWLLGRRAIDPAMEDGHRAFRAYWLASGAGAIVLAFFMTTARVGVLPLPAQLSILELFVLTHAAGSAGLVKHALFLLRGRDLARRAGVPVFLAVFYAGTLALFAMDVRSIGFVESELVMDAAGLDLASLTLVMGGLFAPLALVAVAYGWLLLKTPDRTTQFRVGALALSVMMSSFAPAIWMGADALDRVDVLVVAIAMIALAPLAVLFAYAPPRWMQRRLRVSPLVQAGEVLDVLAGRVNTDTASRRRSR